ncbi:chaperone modulator CbpM [uncultured Desulfovibrio sp.]|uniref:chaperone modulator CbpM n=1 Tax=uncultured Desulfovibrio sp. TaxID=167968 RepID=UPI0025EBDFB7|nr:chaperone modulator CbpM [uncultured Desulfovibrio sp.]
MSLLRKNITLPTPSGYMVWEEFVASTGIDPDRLRELLALGWLDIGQTSEQPLFRDVDIYRVRKLERICCDFELPVLGGTIIVDLLERVDQLERRVRDLRGLDD